MSRATELIHLLKSIDALGIKKKWNQEQLEDYKRRAIIDYQNDELKAHHLNDHE